MKTNQTTEKELSLPAHGMGGVRARSIRMAALAVAAVGGLCLLVGGPLLRFVGNAEAFRAWADGTGLWGRLAFVGLMAAQIVLAFIPGEPLEIAAGCAFGPVEGTLLCMLGALLGGTGVFLLVRRLGLRAAGAFFPMEKVLTSPLLADRKKLSLMAFVLFLIPGTPKDLLTYCAGLTDMRLSCWMCITSLARFPSIITSTLGGDALSGGNLPLAAAVFGVTAVISVGGIWFYRRKAR